MCASFPVGFEDGMWDLIVLVCDYCLSFFSLIYASFERKNMGKGGLISTQQFLNNIYKHIHLHNKWHDDSWTHSPFNNFNNTSKE